MRTPTKAPPIKRFLMLLVTMALAAVGVVGVAASPAAAATGNILPPFSIGETWSVCEGYNYGTHTGTSAYGLDLVKNSSGSCDNSSSGATVKAPIDGTVYYYQASYGNLCVNIAGGRSYTLTHITSSITSGSVTAGQTVGSVGAAGMYNNNGVAHIHFQMWSASNCYNSSVMPFDTADGARICGAPDLTSSGPSGGNGTWSGTAFTGQDCSSSSLKASSPLSFSAPGGYYANAPLTTSFTVYNNSNASVSIASLIVAVRDPANVNYDQTCKTNFSLAAGASYTCSITQWWNSVGTYTMWPDWEDANGTWHTGDLGSQQTVTLSAPGVLEAVSPLAISTPSGAYANAPINESFTVKNTTGSTQSIVVLTLSVRDPAGVNYDQACNRNFSLAAGASYTCSLSQSWGSTGTYTMWADWEDTSGNWHQGQLGPNQQITLS